MTTVVIADDQALIRTAVRGLVEHEEGLTIVGEAVDGSEAVDAARRLHPDVVLMDIRMPGMDGIEATRVICADPRLSGTRVLILTTFEEDEYIVRALRAGASGFVGKGMDAADLMRAIHTVAHGEALLSATATRSLIRRSVLQPAAPEPDADLVKTLAGLTQRETEILELVARGLSNQDIAERLYISTSTAKTHVNRTMTKLAAHDRAQLVIFAYESGLLAPGDDAAS
ncbi:response regulator [uncultured Amnibacterium sp.]|uniref:response regulator n=1 Tax=uncultured Amnibacterium sp. TaxID=1631851 RepID=UPI0035CB6833